MFFITFYESPFEYSKTDLRVKKSPHEYGYNYLYFADMVLMFKFVDNLLLREAWTHFGYSDVVRSP